MSVGRYKEFCNKEIGVDSLPLKDIALKFYSDRDSGWEGDVDGLVEIIKEINVGVDSDGG